MTVQTAFVRCTATEGQFASEYAVSVRTKAGRLLSFFADKQLVQRNGSEDGLLQVQVVDNGSSKRVLLPTESFEEGSQWADLELAGAS